jgi:hypothetical protein
MSSRPNLETHGLLEVSGVRLCPVNGRSHGGCVVSAARGMWPVKLDLENPSESRIPITAGMRRDIDGTPPKIGSENKDFPE